MGSTWSGFSAGLCVSVVRSVSDTLKCAVVGMHTLLRFFSLRDTSAVTIYPRQKNPRKHGFSRSEGGTSGSGLLPVDQVHVPDLILVQARVRARSASRGNGCKVYSEPIAASVGYRFGLLRIAGSTSSVASLFGFG